MTGGEVGTPEDADMGAFSEEDTPNKTRGFTHPEVAQKKDIWSKCVQGRAGFHSKDTPLETIGNKKIGIARIVGRRIVDMRITIERIIDRKITIARIVDREIAIARIVIAEWSVSGMNCAGKSEDETGRESARTEQV